MRTPPFCVMTLPTGTHRGSGLTRSEAAILAWKKRARHPKPGALDPKIAARVKEILAGKQKGKRKVGGKGKKGPDKAKLVAAATAKQERTKAKEAASAARLSKQMQATAAHETAKRERDAKVAARVVAQQAKQAASQAKLKKAASGKKEKAKAAAGKQSATQPDKKQADNRAKVAKDMADQDVGLSPSGSTALAAFADGKPLTKETAAQFESMGLTEKGSDGTHRLTTEGRAAATAMSRGDTRGAIDAISKGADRKKAKADKDTASAARTSERDKAKADHEKTKADSDKAKAAAQAKRDASAARVEAARIEAARSRTRKAWDMDHLSEVDDLLAIKAGARHSKLDASHLDEASRHLHAAGATCPDCAPEDEDEEGMKAIKGIMENPAWYASHECGDVMQACSALQTLAMLIQSELSEEDEDDASIAQLCDAAETLVEFIQGELSELRGAASDATEQPNAASVQTMKGIELGTLDDGEEIAVVSGYAVKSLGDTGLVGGYLVKFGGDGDLSQWLDVFTKNTNYGKHTKSDVWVHHRMLPGLGKKGFTNQAELSMDDEGVFFKHILDLRKAYEAKFYAMIQAGKIGLSSGTAPHLVERKALGDGRHEVTQWTLGLDASYTPMPAGGFVVNAGAMKSLFDDAGIDLLNAMYIDDSPEAVKSGSTRPDGVEVDKTRARRLVLELSLMELEETAL